MQVDIIVDGVTRLVDVPWHADLNGLCLRGTLRCRGKLELWVEGSDGVRVIPAVLVTENVQAAVLGLVELAEDHNETMKGFPDEASGFGGSGWDVGSSEWGMGEW